MIPIYTYNLTDQLTGYKMNYILIAIMLTLSQCVYADRYHDDHITNVYPTEYITQTIENRSIEENSSGAALGIATGQLNFDYSTQAWQVGAGLGNYQDSKAGAIGVAKRFGGVLLNGSYGKESNSEGYGLGATVRFK